MTGQRILIVDDNQSHSKLEKLALADGAYDIRIAADAEEALKVVQEFHPQLIVMDIQLPGVDGLALTRKIKADPNYKNIIIVAVTAYGMKGDKEMALDAGCDGYLSKPIDIETFPDVIRGFLGNIKVSQ